MKEILIESRNKNIFSGSSITCPLDFVRIYKSHNIKHEDKVNQMQIEPSKYSNAFIFRDEKHTNSI